MSAPLTLIFLDSTCSYQSIHINEIVKAFITHHFLISEIAFGKDQISWSDYERMPAESRRNISASHQMQFEAQNSAMRFEVFTQIGWGKDNQFASMECQTLNRRRIFIFNFSITRANRHAR